MESQNGNAYERPATIMNLIDAGAIPDIGNVLRSARQKFNPPPGWHENPVPYTPPRVDVTLSVPEGLAYLAEHLGRQIDLTAQRYMEALLSEALHEALRRVGVQVNPPADEAE